MKKNLFFLVLLTLGLILPTELFAQTTEGKDFWVTLMRGDSRNYDELSLTFSAKNATTVFVENIYTGYFDTVQVGDNAIQQLSLNLNAASCYVTDEDEEVPSNHALHVTSDKPISLIAANYKDKSFDVASILPTSALMSEYRIQCYSPFDHSDPQQGSHFAIVAAEDNVVVDITPTITTLGGKAANQTFTTDTLKKGQVYYVWSGEGKGDNYDFTGTVVKARNNQKIAVFNGNSHTNIPDVRDRDHIYSQAMPINYWGKRFAITSSLTTIDEQTGYWERIDKIRVQALVDGTIVRIDGDSVYTFDFASNPKHYYEFDFGAKDGMTNYAGDGHDYFEGASHYIETSCPSAVHLFMTSNRYDHDKLKGVNEKYCNGDPSELWVNPIEQKIKTLTFGTFETKQVQDHFINIVTTKDNVASVKLDDADISNQFQPLAGNPDYMFARITGVVNGTHTLVSDSGFIAHVYGFGEKESYAYPAGGNTIDLTAFITINGIEYRPGVANEICGEDKVVFGCQLNYEYDSIYWNFGDEKDSLSIHMDSIAHAYAKSGKYNAYVLIYRHMNEEDNCINFNLVDSIPFIVNIGKYKFSISDPDIPCPKDGETLVGKIYYDNEGQAIDDANVTIEFDEVAQRDGFKNDELIVTDKYFQITIPDGAQQDIAYGIHLKVVSSCAKLDTVLAFQLNYPADVITQRYDNVLGLQASFFEGKNLSDFQWYRTSDSTAVEGQISPNLNFYELPKDKFADDAYYVCFTVNKGTAEEATTCACAKKFLNNSSVEYSFDANPDNLAISATYAVATDKIFVNADWAGETDIECYAQWINASGSIYKDLKFNIPDGGCTIDTPDEKGLYLLRVITGKNTRSFKFIIK